MVQGSGRGTSTSLMNHGNRDPTSKKAGFDAIQKKAQENQKKDGYKNQQEGQKPQNGAWGPVFKNKQHFVNMHIA